MVHRLCFVGLKGIVMSRNAKQTSARVASLAAKTLQDESASALQRSLAGSALRQAGAPAETGAKTEAKAGKALDNPNSSDVTLTLAGSVTAQSRRSR